MKLTLARWIVDLQTSPSALTEAVARRYVDFECDSNGEPDLVVEVSHEASTPGSGAGSTSVLHAPIVAKGEKFLLDGHQLYGIIEPSQGRAALRTCVCGPALEVEYFLRIVLAFFALQRDGVLVHSAALRRKSQVSLFVGQSGSGKSTVVSLSAAADRATALGDDLILLRREDEGWVAHGTPFWNLCSTGRDDQVAGGRVIGIYKLVQDREVFTEPMSTAAATAELVANCPIVNDQPALIPALVDRCRNIAKAVAVRRLHFRKDDAFWDVILNEAA